MVESTSVETEQQRIPTPVQSVIAGTWKEMLVRFIFDQGATVTILLSILIAIVYYTPLFLNQIQTGYTKNSEALKETVKYVIESHDKDREMFERALDRK